MKTWIHHLGAVALLAAIATFTSCKDDGNLVPESKITWTLTLPGGSGDGTLSDAVAALTNINTNTTYSGAVSAVTKATVITVTATVPEGLYRLSLEGKLTYTASDNSTVTTSVRAYQESVAITGESFSVPETQMSFYSPSEGFVISEIFFTGTTTSTEDAYGSDQYIKIRNNSDETLYADSLALLQSEFLPNNKKEYSPNIMSDYFSVSSVFMIPGTGKDVPVEPGQELVIAVCGIDHREYNPRSFDLSKADFEIFDADANELHPDTDGPVANLDKWYSSSLTITSFHNRGSETFALARMQGTKEDFLRDNKYTATYLFVFGDFSKEMTTDTYKVPNAWIVDAVNCSPRDEFEWLVIDSSLDAGWTWCAENNSDAKRFNTAVVRKTAAGGTKLQDTNNSTNDFTPHATPSLMQ